MADQALPATGEDFWGIDGSIVMYGIMADVLCLVPLILYLTVTDANSWAPYHQTYINMLWTSYAPLGISWWIVLADDGKFAREAVTGAIEVAGVGPFALLWVGAATYLMQAKDASQLLAANGLLWMWGPLYFAINILLIVLHYHLSPVMYAWLALAPQRVAGVDTANAWAQPENWVDPSTVVVEAPVAKTEETEEEVEPEIDDESAQDFD